MKNKKIEINSPISLFLPNIDALKRWTQTLQSIYINAQYRMMKQI